MPDVERVTGSFPFPLTGEFSPIRWGTEEAGRDPNRFQAIDFQIMLSSYSETMRTPLLAGRTFTEEDNLPGRTDLIVDESLAGKAFPGQSEIGEHIFTRIRTPEPHAAHFTSHTFRRNSDRYNPPRQRARHKAIVPAPASTWSKSLTASICGD